MPSSGITNKAVIKITPWFKYLCILVVLLTLIAVSFIYSHSQQEVYFKPDIRAINKKSFFGATVLGVAVNVVLILLFIRRVKKVMDFMKLMVILGYISLLMCLILPYPFLAGAFLINGAFTKQVVIKNYVLDYSVEATKQESFYLYDPREENYIFNPAPLKSQVNIEFHQSDTLRVELKQGLLGVNRDPRIISHIPNTIKKAELPERLFK
jgi:hypothetical protein